MAKDTAQEKIETEDAKKDNLEVKKTSSDARKRVRKGAVKKGAKPVEIETKESVKKEPARGSKVRIARSKKVEGNEEGNAAEVIAITGTGDKSLEVTQGVDDKMNARRKKRTARSTPRESTASSRKDIETSAADPKRQKVMRKPSFLDAGCVTKSIQWGGRTLTLETGRMARQATSAVVATYGETVVLCTVVANPKADPNVSYTPFLSVHYQTKAYAAGQIPGGYFKRESKPSEKEVLVSRLIDRPIRPLFPETFYNEIQVICTVLSYDGENDADIVAMVGASAALTTSGIPFKGPIAGARVGFKEGKYVLNPTKQNMADMSMDLVVAGTQDGVLMVESEIAELKDKVVLGGVTFGHKEMQPVLAMIKDLRKDVGKTPWAEAEDKQLVDATDAILKKFKPAMEKAFKKATKGERTIALDAVYSDVEEAFGEDKQWPLGDAVTLTRAFGKAKEAILRKAVLQKKRLDGRALDEVRPIACDVSVLPRVHGSALFTRGETQALVVTTLGSSDDAQIMDELGEEYKESFMLHYNFPAFSVGEARRLAPPGRREIGHGKLAWRAIRPVLPGVNRFPYTLRVVSEVLESNGSSSMATVCGTSLALMDAGVSLQRPVAGIAMGLVQEGKKHAVLSDISADEDCLGDMDFKVACSEKGLTALQMDIKVTSITPAIMEEALTQAQAGCKHILGEMQQALQSSRKQLHTHAPRIEDIVVPKDKVRDIIGPGGSVIRGLCQETDAQISIDDNTGTVSVFAPNQEKLDVVKERIKSLTYVPVVGDVLEGKVVDILDFGAFVRLDSGQDGLLHISELAEERVKKVTDVLSKGENLRVKVIGLDRGRIKLSLKQASNA